MIATAAAISPGLLSTPISASYERCLLEERAGYLSRACMHKLRASLTLRAIFIFELRHFYVLLSLLTIYDEPPARMMPPLRRLIRAN